MVQGVICNKTNVEEEVTHWSAWTLLCVTALSSDVGCVRLKGTNMKGAFCSLVYILRLVLD